MHKRDVYRLNKWYADAVRPFLSTAGDGRLDEFDGQARLLSERAEKLCNSLLACFVGGSGVGKSTLINCLVGRHEVVVPSGGVGPLTAQALKIEYGERPALRAIYHAPATVWKLVFALEKMFAADLASGTSPPLNDLLSGMDDEAIEEVEDLAAGDDFEKRKKSDQYLKQARLLVTGQQEGAGDVAYVVDSLRDAIGKERIWGTTLRELDEARLERLRTIFKTKEIRSESICELEKGDEHDVFDRELHDHATGFLAPAIKSLEISWDADLLRRGLELVDLPGVGVAGDVHRAVTDAWMRGDANAVILVVNHRGVHEADADLLRASGFLNRLLHSADDPSADPVVLLVAVVKTDEIAESRRATDKSKSKREHLACVMEECERIVRSQIRERLEEVWSLDGLQLTETKRDIVNRLIAGLQIFPVSSTQFRKLVADDEDDVAFIKDEEESGIPQLYRGLGTLADDHRRDCNDRFAESLTLFQDRLTSALLVSRAQWEEGARASEEAERLQRQLDEFLLPLRQEFHARQGQFRAFLKEVLPAQIETVIAKSRQSSSISIRSYLRQLRNAHWATLRAAVRRGGTFIGSRHIDLPRDFAQTFEEPIAEAWSQQILKQVRQRTKEYSDDCIALMERIVVWAREKGGHVQPKLIEAQQKAIQNDARQLTSVGRELVNELRDRVRQDLVNAIESPIRRKCQAFVRRNEDVGTGVKNRILDLFEELADEAIDAAAKPAEKVLLENYRAVEQQIREVFQSHHNPLQSAETAIVSSHHDHVKRSDAQKRTRIIKEIDAIIELRPTLFEETHSLVAQG